LPKKIAYTVGIHTSAVFSGGAGGARAPPEFGGSQKRQSLISAYQSLAITMNTPGFEKLNTALHTVGKSTYAISAVLALCRFGLSTVLLVELSEYIP
jgi:hypothetical protein